MATKQQERDALKKIKAIVEGLGTESYIGWAFDGAFELAEENIDLDAAYSVRGTIDNARNRCDQLADQKREQQRRAEKAEKEVANLREMIQSGTQRIESQHQEIKALKQQLQQAQDTIASWENKAACERQMLEHEIMKLKARLFDLLDK